MNIFSIFTKIRDGSFPLPLFFSDSLCSSLAQSSPYTREHPGLFLYLTFDNSCQLQIRMSEIFCNACEWLMEERLECSIVLLLGSCGYTIYWELGFWGFQCTLYTWKKPLAILSLSFHISRNVIFFFQGWEIRVKPFCSSD